MAELVAVIASTHHPFYYRASTAIGADRPPFADEWVRKVEAFRETLTRARPDVLVMVGSDHFHQLWLDNMPQFLVGKAPFYDGNFYNEEREFGLPKMLLTGQEDLSAHVLREGLDAGFDLVAGGHKLSGDGYDHGYYVEPTIFDRVDNASKLGQEEIFGPVVAVTTFRDEDEAVELANAVDFGLVAGVWSADYPRAMRVARRIRAGTVWIWDNYAQPVEGIWGGYKQSGMGRELGYHGLNDFLEVKQIFTDGTGLAMKPPYKQVIKE